jgi:hypothetical protein
MDPVQDNKRKNLQFTLAETTQTDMKKATSGWVVFTREKVGGFDPQNDSNKQSANGRC